MSMYVVGWILRPFRPRGTVRLRMTVLYGGLFLLSGAALLAIASGLVVRSSSTAEVSATKAPEFGSSGGDTQAALDKARQEIQSLQAALANQSASRPGISHELLVASLIALGIMVAVSVLLGWIFAGRSLRPLRLITATARRISEDNLDERLAFGGPRDELKDLADTFDGLLERLESAFTAQRRFVANASHELRTPLATMRAAVDVAAAKPGPPVPEPTMVLASRLRAELDRTDELLEGLLVLARAHHGALPNRDVVGLAGVVAEAVRSRSAAIESAGLSVRVSGDALLPVTGSEVMLRRMVDNVVDNAIVHNAPRGWIAVGAWAGPGTGRIVVENGGPVLDQNEVSELAQPFRRLGPDRIGSDRGSGLGLSIVAAIAAAHGGSLELRARPEGGLQVAITLPLSANQVLAGAPS